MKTGISINPVYEYTDENDVGYNIVGYAHFSWWKDEALDEKNVIRQYGQSFQHNDIRGDMIFEISKQEQDDLLEMAEESWFKWAIGKRLVRKDGDNLCVVEFKKLSDYRKYQ